MNRTEEAISFALEKLNRHPNIHPSILPLVYQHLDHGPEEVARLLHVFVQIDKDNPKYWDLLGVARQKAGDLKGAIAACSKAIDLNPEEPTYRYALGRAYQKLGKIDEAKEAYRKAKELNPHYKKALQRLRELS